MQTPYGEAIVYLGDVHSIPVCFMPRHGFNHSIPPHKINYRANIFALKKIGVKKVLATAAVGSLDLNIKPGTFFIPDQFIDFTKNRVHSFFNGDRNGVVHVDMTEPYCPELRALYLKALNDLSYNGKAGGTYICTEGPRFETPAEIKMFQQWGGSVVGMTNVPEVVLAREMGLCYAVICIVTNYAAGLTGNVLSHQEVLDMMGEKKRQIQHILEKMIVALPQDKKCNNCSIPEHVIPKE